jgi:hypothetical protein
MAIQIQYRRGTETEWSSANPVLAIGEPGYETDTGKFKVGNGITNWNSLAYSTGDPGPAGNVAIGTTTTGEPGTDAIVVNTGNGTFAVLSFTIPRGNVGNNGLAGSAAPRAMTIEAPSNSEKIVMFFTDTPISLSQIRSVIANNGTSPTTTFSIRYGTDYSESGTEVVTGGVVCSNITTGVSTTSFNNGTVPANNFVWLTTTASSNVRQLHVSLI